MKALSAASELEKVARQISQYERWERDDDDRRGPDELEGGIRDPNEHAPPPGGPDRPDMDTKYGRLLMYQSQLSAIKAKYEKARAEAEKTTDEEIKATTLDALTTKESQEVSMLRDKYNHIESFTRTTPWLEVYKRTTAEQRHQLEELANEIKKINDHLHALAKSTLAERKGTLERIKKIRADLKDKKIRPEEADAQIKECRSTLGDIGHALEELELEAEEERNERIAAFTDYAMEVARTVLGRDDQFLSKSIHTIYHKLTHADMYLFEQEANDDTYEYEIKLTLDISARMKLMEEDQEGEDLQCTGQKEVDNPDEIFSALFRVPPGLEIGSYLRMKSKNADEQDPSREPFQSIHGHVAIEGTTWYLVQWSKPEEGQTEPPLMWQPETNFEFDEQSALGDWLHRATIGMHPLYVYQHRKQKVREGYVFCIDRDLLNDENKKIPNVYVPNDQGMKSVYAHFDKDEAIKQAKAEGLLTATTDKPGNLYDVFDKMRKEDPDGHTINTVDPKLPDSEIEWYYEDDEEEDDDNDDDDDYPAPDPAPAQPQTRSEYNPYGGKCPRKTPVPEQH